MIIFVYGNPTEARKLSAQYLHYFHCDREITEAQITVERRDGKRSLCFVEAMPSNEYMLSVGGEPYAYEATYRTMQRVDVPAARRAMLGSDLRPS